MCTQVRGPKDRCVGVHRGEVRRANDHAMRRVRRGVTSCLATFYQYSSQSHMGEGAPGARPFSSFAPRIFLKLIGVNLSGKSPWGELYCKWVPWTECGVVWVHYT